MHTLTFLRCHFVLSHLRRDLAGLRQYFSALDLSKLPICTLRYISPNCSGLQPPEHHPVTGLRPHYSRFINSPTSARRPHILSPRQHHPSPLPVLGETPDSTTPPPSLSNAKSFEDAARSTSHIRSKTSNYQLIRWPDQAVAPQGAVTPSPERAARPARGGTFAVMRRSRNGRFSSFFKLLQTLTHLQP